MKSPDLDREAIERLRALFPACVTEVRDGKGRLRPAVDFDLLRQELGGEIAEGGDERYRLDWPGKRAAMQAGNAPLAASLRPDRAESVGFETTGNLFIEGDNLDALRLIRESYRGRIKLIYIDPPYNTGRNLMYRNDFRAARAAYLRRAGGAAEDGAPHSETNEANGRFHSDWLSMMYPRLRLARGLLCPDGVLICAIDENEFAALSLMLREIFGEDGYEHSYVAVTHNPRGKQGANVSYVHEYLIFVYPSGMGKLLADFPKEQTDARNLRDSGTESARSDARSCFYPFLVRDGRIIGIGEVAADDHHPGAANIARPDGTVEVWPVTDDGKERKWRYARGSVEAILDRLSPKMGRRQLQIIFHKDQGTMRSLWTGARYDASEYGTKLVEALLPGAGFTYPKSLWAVRDAVFAATARDPGAIVLDFFAGSGTTAHAVMALNAEDGGNRRFILVQAPEPAGKTGFPTIAAIARERIRRAGAELLRGEAHPGWRGDVGFRALEVGEDCMRNAIYLADETIQTGLGGLAGTTLEGCTAEDLLVQVLADRGLDLTLPISAETLHGQPVLTAGENALIACFGTGVTEDLIEAIAARAPDHAVFRAAGFASDTVRRNAGRIFAASAPSTEIWVL